jgi:ribosome maturation factor RimP
VKASPFKIAVFIDRPQGIKLTDCVELNRFLHSKLDDTNVFETHELEVSSPGMDEPLRVKGQYLKRLGQNVSVLMKDGIRKDGLLKEVNDNSILITTKIKNQTEDISIPLEQIKETKLIFSFDKILK